MFQARTNVDATVTRAFGLMSRRIGILRIGSLGDHLIALPIYRQLRELHANDAMILISNLPAQGNKKLVGPSSVLPDSLFNDIYNYPVGTDWHSVAQKWRLFRRAKLSSLYYMMPRRSRQQLWRDQVFFLLTGTRVIGLTTDVAGPYIRYSDGGLHAESEADRLVRGIPALTEGLINTPASRSLALTEAERDEARMLMGPSSSGTIAISIGTKCDTNDWGLEKWSQLVVKLSELPQVQRIVLLGSPDEFDYSEKLKALWPRYAENFCGRLSPRISAAVLEATQLFVGHDSGPMHMAAAVSVPIVAIFSSRNPPGMWFPLSENKRIHYTRIDCMGCGRLRCEDLRKECIKRISVDDVYASCVAALAA